MASDDLTIRPCGPEDRDQVMAVAAGALGWADDERDRAFFRWKHEENPVGPSPAWIAIDDGAVVAFRTFLRWQFEGPRGDLLHMARAVDTATAPSHQGRGLFTRLTRQAVADLTEAGVDAIFNTPNDQSRPGYLKMGWHQLGRPTIGMRPAALRRLPILRQARTASDKWSEPCTIGEPAADALRDPAVGGLLLRTTSAWATPRSAAYLAWRYRFEPLHYRVVEAGGGLVVFRVRRRGPAREVAIVEWLAPRPDRAALARLVEAAGDYAVGVGLGLDHGLLPLPRQGPIITWRPLARPAVPALGDLALSLGDLELF